jgi:uncharacterized OB-fold protein
MLPPLPEPGPDTREFWSGCCRHEIRLQRCRSCARARFSPRPGSPWCGALEFDWFTASGRGRIYSWTVVHRPTLPGFEALVPYAAVLVELDEGPFLVGQLRGCAADAITAGLAVRVEWEDGDDVSLPHWRTA